MTAVEFFLIEDDIALQSVKEEWLELTDQAGSPIYVTFHYCANTWHLIQKPLGRQLYCVAGYVENQLVFLWPLIKYQHHRLWTVLRALTAHAAEFSDVAISPAVSKLELMQGALQFIRTESNADVLNLPFVMHDTILHSCLASIKGVGADIDIVPFLKYTDAEIWETYTASLGGNHRRSLTRRLKVLANGDGKVDFVIAEQDDDIQEYISWLIQAKRAWVQEKQKQDASLDTDDFRKFLIKLATSEETRHIIKVFALLLNGEPVSVKIVAVRNYQANRVIAAYDLRYSKASPGMLLDEFVMKWIINNKYSCNFGVGAEASKLVWSRNQILTATSYQMPLTKWGKLAYNLWKYRNKVAGHKAIQIPAELVVI